eukprot:8171423-Pyramimonas_sp.AAC.1
MFRIVKAICDSDKMRGVTGGTYLQKAAALVRKQASKGLSKKAHTHLDEHMVLVFEAGGPRYYPQSELCKMLVRRVGGCYSTRDFYNQIYRDALLDDGRVERVISFRAVRAGGELHYFADDKSSD